MNQRSSNSLNDLNNWNKKILPNSVNTNLYTYASFAFKEDDGATSREKCKNLCLRYYGTTTLQIQYDRDNLLIICQNS